MPPRFLAAVKGSHALHGPWTRPPETRARFAAFVARFAPRAAITTHAGFLVFRRDDDALVGVFNFSEIVRGAFQSTYLGYYAFAPHAGRGYMTEAMALALDVALRPAQAAPRRSQRPADERALACTRGTRRIHARGLFAPLREDRRPLARPRPLRDAGRRLARRCAARRRAVMAAGRDAETGRAVAAGGAAVRAGGVRGRHYRARPAEDVATALPIAPYEIHEECAQLVPGDRARLPLRGHEPGRASRSTTTMA